MNLTHFSTNSGTRFLSDCLKLASDGCCGIAGGAFLAFLPLVLAALAAAFLASADSLDSFELLLLLSISLPNQFFCLVMSFSRSPVFGRTPN